MGARRPRWTMAAAMVMLTGCASGTYEGVDGAPPLPKPSLHTITPDAFSLGDAVRVIGEDFVTDNGSLWLRLDGEYATSGGSVALGGELRLSVTNRSVAEVDLEKLWGGIAPDDIGVWSGTATLINRHEAGDVVVEETSEIKDVSFRVLPSLVLSRLRSADVSGCAPITRGTNPHHNLELGVRAIGFGAATPAHPWTVRFHFRAPELTVRYLVPDAFDFWPIDGPLDDSLVTPARAGEHSIELTLTDGDGAYLDPTRWRHKVRPYPAARIGGQQYDTVDLLEFAAGPVPGTDSSQQALVVADIETDDGRSLRRVIEIDIHNPVEIRQYDGNQRLVRRLEAEQVSACFAGGDIGGDLTYTEGQSQSLQRSLGFRWDRNSATSLGTNIGSVVSIVQLQGNQSWSASFGMDVTEVVSSDVHKSLNLSRHILPSYFGTCYRQTEEIAREVDILYHNACGASGVVGKAVLTDWNWGFDVATGPDCPPKTNLPPGESFED